MTDFRLGDDGYMLAFKGEITAGICHGRITSWRRVRGNQWTVTIYDLGEWRFGQHEKAVPLPERRL